MGWRTEMQSLYESLQLIGMESLDSFWFPTLIWTLIALAVFLTLKSIKRLNPIYLYHLRVATVAAIPVGLLSSFIIQKMIRITEAERFDPAVFVVEAPKVFFLDTSYKVSEFTPNWFEPNFLIGLITAFIFAVSFIMIFRLLVSYLRLRKLHTTLSKTKLGNISEFDLPEHAHIKLSFYEHPMVPFTFGWNSPVIVLPEHIKDDHEKVRMAIQHELVHIQRGDYLLQLGLSVIESIFWFHPLIHFGSREIETYREISCDQQVLSTSGFSLKEYASMLYELMPLNRELGSFSVSMAVKQSTLRHRIETMKYHNLYNTSIKRSILFFFTMILAVTLPIACSDLRGPDTLSAEDIQGEKITLENLSVSVNGVEVLNNNNSGTGSISVSGLGAIGVQPDNYGTFIFSLRKFDGAALAGSISENVIHIEINELKIEMVAASNILENNREADLWVKHEPGLKGSIRMAAFPNPNDLSFAKVFGSENTGLSDNGDHFVVVEEMPKLVGGIRSVQSKIKYPEEARKAGIEGRVILQFIVDENGDVLDPKIVRGIGGGADEEALRVIREAKFEPGIQRGKEVKVQYSLPIVFRLSDTD